MAIMMMIMVVVLVVVAGVAVVVVVVVVYMFTMEEATDGHIPFLDIDTYRRPDSSLRRRVYRKRTNTNLYLKATCHHGHPANKQAVLFT
jgi:hypothetical protein